MRYITFFAKATNFSRLKVNEFKIGKTIGTPPQTEVSRTNVGIIELM